MSPWIARAAELRPAYWVCFWNPQHPLVAMLLKLLLTAVLASACLDPATEEREIAFEGVDGFRLNGTLLVPDDQRDVLRPAVLLLPGSGPTDRDGNQPPLLKTDLLRQLAEALAQDSVITFRFDKRAAHVHREQWPGTVDELNHLFRWEAFVGDAEAALRLLREQPGVDPNKVMILGHSEGGLIALQLAADLPEDQKPEGLILMGTPGRPMADLLREQVDASFRRAGVPQAMLENIMAELERAMQQIETLGTVPEDLPVPLRPIFNPTAASLLRSYLLLQPAELARSYAGPVAVINGEHDVQVSAQRDAEALARVFETRAEGSVTLKVVPGASHNFKAVAGEDEPGFLGPVVEPALEAVRAFVRELQ